MTADFSIQRRVLDVLCTLGGVALAIAVRAVPPRRRFPSWATM
jgi:hypothetical protein